MIKVLLILLILNHVSLRAQASTNHLVKAQIGLGFARDEIQTTASSSTIASNKNYNQLEIAPQLNYFVDPNFAIGTYYFYKSFMANITSSGIGAYGRYYFKSINTVLSKKLDNKNLTLTPTWTPYAQLGAKTETLEAETVSISFSGLEAGGGVDWHFTENYFLNFALNLSFQLSGDTRTLNSQSFLIGFGKALNF
jgi:hypothetical protein